jgi:hypothetical protein
MYQSNVLQLVGSRFGRLGSHIKISFANKTFQPSPRCKNVSIINIVINIVNIANIVRILAQYLPLSFDHNIKPGNTN